MSNYKKYEMESAMIKMIRRCNLDALYWAFHLIQRKNGATIIWKRLEIMSAEDIGMAYPWLRSYLKQQQALYHCLKEKTAQQQVLLDTVNFFTRQHKSRLCDNLAHGYFKEVQPAVPCTTVAELMELLKQSIEERNVDMGLRCAAHLYKKEEEHKVVDLLRYPKDPESSAIISYFEKENSIQRDYHDLLFFINLILYRIMDFSTIPKVFEVKPLDRNALEQDDRVLEVPDCAYDYHCTIGRNLGRGYAHYYNEGAKINQCYIDDPYEALARSINIPKDGL